MNTKKKKTGILVTSRFRKSYKDTDMSKPYVPVKGETAYYKKQIQKFFEKKEDV